MYLSTLAESAALRAMDNLPLILATVLLLKRLTASAISVPSATKPLRATCSFAIACIRPLNCAPVTPNDVIAAVARV